MPTDDLRLGPGRPEPPKWKKYGHLGWKLLRSINVEPAIFFFALQLGIQLTCLQPFLYWRVCTEKFIDIADNIEDFCLTLSENNDTDKNDEVEAVVSTFQVYLTVCTSIPAFFLCPIICAWSDGGGGRKRPLAVAMAATVVAHVPYLVCTAMPSVSYYWILLGASISALGGSAMVVFASAFSSITDESRMKGPPNKPPLEEFASDGGVAIVPSDLSKPETVSDEDKIITIRIGLGTATFMLGMVFGCLAGTLCRASQNYSAYYWPFLVSEVSVAIGFFYVVFVARETFEPDIMIPDETVLESRRDITADPKELFIRIGDRLCGTCKGFYSKLKDAVHVLIRPREGKKRLLIWVGLSLNFLQMCCSMGVGNLIVLFVKRKPLSWSDVEYGYFQVYINAMAAIGMTIIPFIVNRIPGLRNSPSKDTIIVMIGCVSSATYFSLLTFAATDAQVYAAGFFMLFAQLFLPGFRSFFSKIVGEEETARIFAAVGMLENFTPMIAAIFFTQIYNASLNFHFAGFAFIISAVLHIPILLGMGYIHTMYVKEANKSEILVDNMEVNEDTEEKLDPSSYREQELSTPTEDKNDNDT